MSKGILWSFGDSFTAGNAKVMGHGVQYPFMNTIGKKRAYPHLIARELSMTSVNLAVGGSDNNIIFEQVVNAYPNMDKERDCAIIALSTPFRGNPNRSEQEVLRDLNVILSNLETLLHGHTYIITSAFCPLIPAFFNPKDLNYTVKNYVEWGKHYNTLIDICCGTWLRETSIDIINSDKYLSDYDLSEYIKTSGNLEMCGHPNNKGHDLIAKTLLPYLQKWIHKRDEEQKNRDEKYI